MMSSGASHRPIVDTWWQTKTVGAMIAPLPGTTDLKPGSATKPLPGVLPEQLDDKRQFLKGTASGNPIIMRSWPGQMRSVWGGHDRFFQTYFTTYPGVYNRGRLPPR